MIDIAAIKARADKATSGPWESDATQNEGDYGSGPDCVSGFSSYEVIAEKGRICDTINSDVAMVCEEYDEDGCTAFDEVGQANMDFIAHARTDIPALISALEASEAAYEARITALEAERDALKAALKPFADAKIPEHVLGQYIKISVMTIPFNGEHDIAPYAFHAARRALESKP